MRVLLVEDDETLGEAVRDHIAAQAHAVDWARSLAGAGDCLAVARYQLLLLDLRLPDGDGIGFLAALRRRRSDVPVIILTARDQLSDRIAGLNAGADDYLVKPFSLAELSARLGAVARRYAGSPNPLVRIGALEIDLAIRRVRRDAREVALTAREWAVLERLLDARGAVVAKAAPTTWSTRCATGGGCCCCAREGRRPPPSPPRSPARWPRPNGWPPQPPTTRPRATRGGSRRRCPISRRWPGWSSPNSRAAARGTPISA